MNRGHYPAARSHSQIGELKPVPLYDEGTEGSIARYAWMTDGTVKPIEEGLPVSGTPPPALDSKRDNPLQRMVKMIVEKPYLKDFYKCYGALAAAHPDLDPNDPDMLSHYEKQLIATYYQDGNDMLSKSEMKVRVSDPVTHKPKMTSRAPLDAHLHTWGGAIPYMDTDMFDDIDAPTQKKATKKLPKRTGVYGERDPHSEDEVGIIREVYFKTLDGEPLDKSLSRDHAGEPLIFPQGGRYLHDYAKKGRTSDPTVQKCIKKYFDPNVGVPFIPADSGDYFPLDLLTPGDKLQVAPSSKRISFADNASMVSQTYSMGSDDDDCGDEPSTLLDTSDQDVLFTKNKAPFTRKDISTLRQFDNKWETLRRNDKKKMEETMKQRQKYVKQAFHSKAVFETYLKLMDEDCKRIRSGIIGKSQFKKVSLWERAVKEAPVDNSGLDKRRDFWWRLCAFVRFNGGLIEKLDREVVRSIRHNIILGHEIAPSLFWNVIKYIDPQSLENVAALKVIEFCRIFFDIGQQELLIYLDEVNVSRLMYNQAIQTNTSLEFSEKMKELAKGPMEVPECD